ncbi:hypothetical protein KR044_013049, partial [Drosophila immigrans]
VKLLLALYGLILLGLVHSLRAEDVETTTFPPHSIDAPSPEDEIIGVDDLNGQLQKYGVIVNTLNLCENIANNTFLPVVGSQSAFIRCRDGDVAYVSDCNSNQATVEKQCDGKTDCKLVFNYKLQTCPTNLSIDHLSFMPSCERNVLTSFCYDRTCTKYVLCYYNLPVLRECQDGLQYNAVTDRCDFPDFVDCVENYCSDEIKPENITFVPSKASCDKYYICADGMPYAQECAEGLYFDPDCSCCKVIENVKCKQTPQQRNIKPFSRLPPQRADIVCPQQGVHFYAHKRRPDAYYYCVQGEGITLDCTPGLLFDPKTHECREPKYIA